MNPTMTWREKARDPVYMAIWTMFKGLAAQTYLED